MGSQCSATRHILDWKEDSWGLLIAAWSCLALNNPTGCPRTRGEVNSIFATTVAKNTSQGPVDLEDRKLPKDLTRFLLCGVSRLPWLRRGVVDFDQVDCAPSKLVLYLFSKFTRTLMRRTPNQEGTEMNTTQKWIKCFDFPYEMSKGTVAVIDGQLVVIEKSLWLNPRSTHLTYHVYGAPTQSKTINVDSTQLVQTYLLTEV